MGTRNKPPQQCGPVAGDRGGNKGSREPGNGLRGPREARPSVFVGVSRQGDHLLSRRVCFGGRVADDSADGHGLSRRLTLWAACGVGRARQVDQLLGLGCFLLLVNRLVLRVFRFRGMFGGLGACLGCPFFVLLLLALGLQIFPAHGSCGFVSGLTGGAGGSGGRCGLRLLRRLLLLCGDGGY